jgi:hypothetical protein
MPQPHICSHCSNSIPSSADRCPHCARPGYYPNVRAAEVAEEVDALENRYVSSLERARLRGAERQVLDFEATVRNSSVAVLARSISEVQRLVSSDNELYATFYQLLEGGLRMFDSSKWSVLRGVADAALFPGYAKEIRFACLSLDDTGLPNYGECSIRLRTGMIAHRSTVFECNSTVFMGEHDIRVAEADRLPFGYRATWDDRGKLCTAKLADNIDDGTISGEYLKILLTQGATTGDDQFVEVNIWGALTVRAIERLTITKGSKSSKKVIAKAIRERLQNAGVSVDVKV